MTRAQLWGRAGLAGLLISLAGIGLMSTQVPSHTTHAQGAGAIWGPPGPTGPQGSMGPQGAQGNNGADGSSGSAGTNGTNGAAATVTTGTLTMGTPGSSPSVTNSGSSSAAVLNFQLPAAGCNNGYFLQCASVTTATSGAYTWTYSTPLPAGKVPIILVTPQGSASGSVNAFVTAVSNTAVTIQVTNINFTFLSLLGLNVLTVPATPGATTVQLTAIYPG